MSHTLIPSPSTVLSAFALSQQPERRKIGQRPTVQGPNSPRLSGQSYRNVERSVKVGAVAA